MKGLPIDPHAFLESSPLVPIALCPETGRVSFVGPQASEHLGYPRAAWLEPDFWSRVVFPDDQTTVERSRANVAAGGRPGIEYRMEHIDGRVIWTSEVLSLARGYDGRPELYGFMRDVTDRKRQEVALWKSEERLRAMLRGAPDAMVVTDMDGVIINMNDQAEALFDYRLAEVAGSSIDHLLPHRLRDRLTSLRAAFERDPRRRSLVDGHSLSIERRDGTNIPVELSMSLVEGGAGEHQVLCSVRDLTHRRRIEAELRTLGRRNDTGGHDHLSADGGRPTHASAASESLRGMADEVPPGPPGGANGGMVGGLAEQLGASMTDELCGPLKSILGSARAARRLLESDAPDVRSAVDMLADILAEGQRAEAAIAALARLRGTGIAGDE